MTSVAQAGRPQYYKGALNLAVLITGLGYLVDTFDYYLFHGMRVVSLTELGLSGDELLQSGVSIHISQVLGAVIGGFFWGILGDKIGRKSALLGSIAVYSLSMLATGFVQDPTTYGIIRFITGFGVAGEIGLGATFVSESVEPSKRTYALMFFTVLGVIGVGLAGVSLEFVSWRVSSIAGGIAGLLLLTLRSFLFETQLYSATVKKSIPRGSLKSLFGNLPTLTRWLLCVPILGCNFFVTGSLLTLCPEIAQDTGVQDPVKAHIALSIYFFASVFGDLLGAWLSNTLKSRRLVAAVFISGNMLVSFVFLQKLQLSVTAFYALCAAFGLFNLWAIAATILVEQFPTELRSTATTSNFNCSRASTVVWNMVFLLFKKSGVTQGLTMLGGLVFALGLFCIWRLPETFGRSLETLEE